MRYVWGSVMLVAFGFLATPKVAFAQIMPQFLKGDFVESPTLSRGFQAGDDCAALISISPDLLLRAISPENAANFNWFCNLGSEETCDDYNDIFAPDEGWLMQNEDNRYCRFIPYRNEGAVSPKPLDGVDPCKFYRQYYGLEKAESCAAIIEHFHISASAD